MDDIKSKIDTVLQDIQQRNSYPVKPCGSEQRIVKDLGFASLDVAELVALLEIEFGFDPFSQGVSLMDVHTVGELYAAYGTQNQSEAAVR